MTEKELLKERIVQLLKESKLTLTKDSISAIITLENEISGIQAIIENLKDGKIKAVYKGDLTEKLNINEFKYITLK